MDSKCKYCDQVAGHRVISKFGPFCEFHWRSLSLWLGIWNKAQLKGLDELDIEMVTNTAGMWELKK